MKQHFDKHAHRLSESEREIVWRQISGASPQAHSRRVRLLVGFAGAGAVVTAGLILAVMLSSDSPERRIEELSPRALPELGAPRTDGGDALAGRPAGSTGEQAARTETAAPQASRALSSESAPGGENKDKAAAPAAPVNESTVATPEAGRRDAAAAPQERGREMRIVRYSELGVPPSIGKAHQQSSGGSLQAEGLPAAAAQPRLDGTLIAGRYDGDDEEYALRRRRCWIPPDYRNPNGEPFDAMYFRDYGTNPFVVTEEDALSTFAVDVDNASYTLVRRYLDEGQLPPREAVRVEEFVNFFEPGYGRVREGDFALHADGAPAPYGRGYHLLRLGLQARSVDAEDRRPANLVFVIDTSGSMDRENRLGMVKRALGMLLDELDDNDTVGIVEYGSEGRVVLPPTSLEDRGAIERAIARLQPNGSTNAEQGLDLGYTMASRIYDAKAINRLILCSDGVANTGETDAARILDKVRYQSDRGIHLSTIGFGMGNYNDVLMETLADTGDGNYYYVDRLEEAQRVFRENLTGTLQTLARDAKIQVEFDPEQVARWRLIGYENREVADRDFRNDTVDAGEIGAGHQVVALYEIKLSEEAERAVDGRADRNEPLRLGTLRLRYELPEQHRRAGEVVEAERRLSTADLSRGFERADAHLRLAALAAEFAEILRGSYWAQGSRLTDLVAPAAQVAADLPRDEAARELARLIERAARLAGDGDWERDREDRPRRGRD